MALRYWVTGGTGNWNSTTNWSASSGGGPGASVPTISDDAIFDGSSGSGTAVITSGATCLTLNVSAFTGTLNMANAITIGTSFTYGTSVTVTGSGGISKTGNGGTWTSNGGTWPNSVTLPLGGGFNTTFADNWIISGNLSGQAAAINLIGSGGVRTITVGGNLSGGAGLNCTNIAFVLNGTGNISGTFTGPSITINTSGTITQSAGMAFNTVNFTYTSGTFNAGTQGLTIGGATNTFNNVSSISFGNIAFAAAAGQTILLNSDMNISGSLTVSSIAGTINGLFNVNVGGNLALNAAGISGTSTIVLTGSTNCSILAGVIQNNLTLNKTTGTTITLPTAGTITWGANGRTLQYTSGTIVVSTSTFSIPNNVSVTINGMIFNNLTLGTSTTITQNALNTIQGVLTCNGTTTFAGTRGFTTATFNAQAAASILTFSNINANPLAEYRITGNLTIIGTALSRITLQAAGSAAFTGTANGTTLTRASGVAPSIGMVVSQATGTAPAGFSALFPNRPVINGGSDPNFTLDLNVTPTTGSIAMRAGYKAVFILENNGVATQNVAYTTCQDIDSSLGQPILSFASNNDDQTTNVSLFRTINWGSLDPPPVQGRNYASVYVY
jgi:fibronectin-binding autotransporter adhesin